MSSEDLDLNIGRLRGRFSNMLALPLSVYASNIFQALKFERLLYIVGLAELSCLSCSNFCY